MLTIPGSDFTVSRTCPAVRPGKAISYRTLRHSPRRLSAVSVRGDEIRLV